ncbi:hypothetical protein Mal52_51280 [Symmachiella dynata]|uniref:ERCC4 domain-containing protein n=1 Tax=Symmachiella dynata TaxID=2527995 RepID=A0A517ZVZ4_9PLAN|nr:ERCC4 domain-containing protein [Symmachiella dynata]QDU46606.1 hypothetical protein Mal52_51280 [Symmachiella dynata]
MSAPPQRRIHEFLLWWILIDTREQLPFDFSRSTVETRVQTLATGDYSAATEHEDYSDRICIERKSAGDFLSCIGHSRERFVRELERMSKFEFAVVMIEAPLDCIVEGDYWTKVEPASVVGSTIAWMQRYGVHFIFAPNRRYAERLTLKMLERFVRDVHEGKRPQQTERITA